MSEIVDILMGPDPYYLLMSNVTKQPFLYEGERALAYTDAGAMTQMESYLQLSGYDVFPYMVNDNKYQVAEDMMAAGVSMISLNECDDGKDLMADQIGAFVEVPQDGFVALEVPLINMELSRLLNYFYQELSVRRSDKHVTDQLFEKLRTSSYLVPINIARCRVADQIIFPFFEDSSDIPVFTDYRICADWLAQCGESTDEWATWVVDWADFKNLMDQNPGTTFYLNNNTVNLHITPDLLNGLNSLITQFSDDLDQNVDEIPKPFDPARMTDFPAGKETALVDDWENDDPSKDFFQSDPA